MIDAGEVLPCPVCGGDTVYLFPERVIVEDALRDVNEDLVYDYQDSLVEMTGYRVRCTGQLRVPGVTNRACYTTGPYSGDRKEAMDLWSTRAGKRDVCIVRKGSSDVLNKMKEEDKDAPES